MKIPFDLGSWLADKSQKVVTRDGKPVRIICTDCKADQPIVALVTLTYEGGSIYESVESYSENGFYFAIGNKDADLDLFLVTDESLTDFEQRIEMHLAYAERGMHDSNDIQDIKDTAKELLDLARKQIEKEVYGSIQKEMDKHQQRLADTLADDVSLDYAVKIVEDSANLGESIDCYGGDCLENHKRTPSPALTKIVENLTPEKLEKTKEEMLAETSDDNGHFDDLFDDYYDKNWEDGMSLEQCAKHFYNLGKAEALKNLPKFRKKQENG